MKKTITAFKGTDSNMYCRGFFFDLNKEYTNKNKPVRCGNNGFHSCLKLADVFRYYEYNGENRFFEVQISGEIDTSNEDSKVASQVIVFIKEITNDNETILAAVSQNGYSLCYVPTELMTPELCLAAVSQNGDSLRCVPTELRTPELCLAAVSQNGDSLDYVPTELSTPELCLAAVSQNGDSLRYVPTELRTPELCLAAVSQNGYSLDYVPTELRTPELIKIVRGD